jgi:coenzyme F420 biosynthesis associated uncharacterized protein
VIEWGIARSVAGLVATEPEPGPPLAGDLPAFTTDAVERVTRYTGLTPVRAVPPPESVSRGGWLDANLTSMAKLLDPVAAKMAAKSKGGYPGRFVAGVVLGAEIGGLSGYLAGRVLGQYELVLLDPSAPERLLFVAPNLRAAARRLGVDESDLVQWVCFHEVTHAVQFTGVPWLREHLAGLLGQLLESVDVEIKAKDLVANGLTDVRALVNRVRTGGLAMLVAGPERIALLDRVQATMAVVEGHAEHVMDAVGAEALSSLDQLRTALDRRRTEKPLGVRLLEKLLGLELKMRQYEVGKAFCDAVVAEGGIAALNRVWDGPASLPTLAELEAPAAWLARTAPPRGLMPPV